MNDFVLFLRTKPHIWGAVILAFFVALGLLAWWITRLPESPFVYRLG